MARQDQRFHVGSLYAGRIMISLQNLGSLLCRNATQHEVHWEKIYQNTEYELMKH